MFLTHLIGLVGHLEARRAFVVEFMESGGTVEAAASLYGRVNIEDGWLAEDLMRLGALGISLRVEVRTEWAEDLNLSLGVMG